MKVFSDPQLFQSWRQAQIPQKVSYLTIGNFDGVHRGHQELVRQTLALKAADPDGLSVVLSFFPHPVEVLRPERKHSRLFTVQDQQEQLSAYGIEVILRQPFSRSFSQMSAHEFLYDYLLKFFSPRGLVVGHDFSFGSDRQGRVSDLEKFCQKEGIQLVIVRPQTSSLGQIISTSAVRQALQKSELPLVSEYLGRPYYIRGIVEKGDQRGRQLGFPTANIRSETDFHPNLGVYAVKVSADFLGEASLPGVMNIGYNKTFKDGDLHPIKMEVHLLNFTGDLYGRILKVELIDYLRPEIKFSSLTELVDQIKLDIAKAKEIFGERF